MLKKTFKTIFIIFIVLVLLASVSFIVGKPLAKRYLQEKYFVKELSFSSFSILPPSLKEIKITFEEDNLLIPSLQKSYLSSILVNSIQYSTKDLKIDQPHITLHHRNNPYTKKTPSSSEIEKNNLSESDTEKDNDSSSKNSDSFKFSLKPFKLDLKDGSLISSNQSGSGSIDFNILIQDIILEDFLIKKGNVNINFEAKNFTLHDISLEEFKGHFNFKNTPEKSLLISLHDINAKIYKLPLQDFSFLANLPADSKTLSFSCPSGTFAEGILKKLSGNIHLENQTFQTNLNLENATPRNYLTDPKIKKWLGKSPVSLTGSFEGNLIENSFLTSTQITSPDLITIPVEYSSALNLLNLSLIPGSTDINEISIDCEGKKDLLILSSCYLKGDKFDVTTVGSTTKKGSGTFYTYSKGQIFGQASNLIEELIEKTPLAKIPFLKQTLNLGKKSTSFIDKGIDSLLKNFNCLKLEIKKWDLSSYKLVSFSKAEKESSLLKKDLDKNFEEIKKSEQ
jgi:hypothetical protein